MDTETGGLTPENLDTAIKGLKKAICHEGPESEPFVGLLLPVAERKLSKRYRGRGRPRKIDYDYKELKWYKKARSFRLLEK